MNTLKEKLQSLTLLCWETEKESDINRKVKEYATAFPHLHNPPSMDLLRECVKVWFRVQDMEKRLEKIEDAKEYRLLSKRVEKLTRMWMAMLGNLGLSWTKQQYISKKTGGQKQPPVEVLKELMKRKKKK